MRSLSNILIVGAGQLGSRHLQAVAKVSEPLQIYVVEPNLANQKAAIERFKEIDGYNRHRLEFLNGLPVSGHFRFCVISTNSDVRFSLYIELLNRVKIDFYLLEKVLFQDIQDYDINRYPDPLPPTFVNCPRRIFDLYNWIKYEIKEPIRSMTVNGANWGMGSNMIHFIDLASFFNASSQYDFKKIEILDLRASVREKFKEFDGSVQITFNGGCDLFVNSLAHLPESIEIELDFEEKRLTILESRGEVHELNKATGDSVMIRQAKVPYQSELTNKVYDELMQLGTCKLTPFKDSLALHYNMINALNQVLKCENGICPIT
jgi:hypothetical protein